jgi:glycosyltransferase involved in cell wall biosynthesis
MKRILLVSPYFIDSYKNNISMGSAVKIAQNLCKIYQVKVLTSGRPVSYEQINSNLDIESVSGLLIPDPVNYMVSFPLLFRFIRQVQTFKPDLVIVSKYMFFSSFVIPLAKFMKVKVITVTDTFPGINWFSVSYFTSIIMWIYARIIGIPLLKMSDRVILLHPGLEDIAKKYKLKFVTIPNGVEEKYLKNLIKPQDIIKPGGEYWVGFVGRPESAKGYSTAFKIADKLKSIKHLTFVFVGGNVSYSKVGNKIFLGFRKDIMNVYQLFDCLILPSNAEGLPNVVMEAMAQGVPVISSLVGGVPFIIQDKKNGFLVQPGDLEGFILGIKYLYNHPKIADNLGILAKQTISRNFNWAKIIQDYKQLINDICVV